MVENPTASLAEQPAAPPPGRSSDLMLMEVAKLQSDVGYLKRDIGEVRSDLREVRGDVRNIGDRLTRLEERVTHLPGKGFIVAVVTTALVLVGGVTTIAPRLQALSTPAAIQQPTPSSIK